MKMRKTNVPLIAFLALVMTTAPSLSTWASDTQQNPSLMDPKTKAANEVARSILKRIEDSDEAKNEERRPITGYTRVCWVSP